MDSICRPAQAVPYVGLPHTISGSLQTLNLLKLIPPTIEHVSVVLFNSATGSGAMLLESLEHQPNLRSIHLDKPMQLDLVARPSQVPLRSLRKISAFTSWDAHALAKNCVPVNLKAMLFSMSTTFQDLHWSQEILEHVEWLFMPYVMLPAAWDTVKPFKNIRFFGIFQFTPQEEDEGCCVLAELPTLESVSIIFTPGPHWSDEECQAIQAIRTADNVIADHPRIQTAYMVQSSMRPTDLCILLQKDESSVGWKLSRFKEGSTIRDMWAEL